MFSAAAPVSGALGIEDSIRTSARRFLTQQDDLVRFAKAVLSGSLRAIVGRLTVEETICIDADGLPCDASLFGPPT